MILPPVQYDSLVRQVDISLDSSFSQVHFSTYQSRHGREISCSHSIIVIGFVCEEFDKQPRRLCTATPVCKQREHVYASFLAVERRGGQGGWKERSSPSTIGKYIYLGATRAAQRGGDSPVDVTSERSQVLPLHERRLPQYFVRAPSTVHNPLYSFLHTRELDSPRAIVIDR